MRDRADSRTGAQPPVTSGGKLIIVSGPSGAGKSTVVRELIARCDRPLRLSVSATTRPPRPGEVHGREYYFVDPPKFERIRREGGFLEAKQVFSIGHWYGTLRRQVDEAMSAGDWLILEIDVQGAMAVLQSGGYDCRSVFIHPGGDEELRRRLTSRGTETAEAIAARLAEAQREMASIDRYDFVLVNDDVDAAVERFCDYLQQTIL